MKHRYENEKLYYIILMKDKDLKHLESTDFESTPLYNI